LESTKQGKSDVFADFPNGFEIKGIGNVRFWGFVEVWN
jgi:hypothetical protein